MANAKSAYPVVATVRLVCAAICLYKCDGCSLLAFIVGFHSSRDNGSHIAGERLKVQLKPARVRHCQGLVARDGASISVDKAQCDTMPRNKAMKRYVHRPDELCPSGRVLPVPSVRGIVQPNGGRVVMASVGVNFAEHNTTVNLPVACPRAGFHNTSGAVRKWCDGLDICFEPAARLSHLTRRPRRDFLVLSEYPSVTLLVLTTMLLACQRVTTSKIVNYLPLVS